MTGACFLRLASTGGDKVDPSFEGTTTRFQTLMVKRIQQCFQLETWFGFLLSFLLRRYATGLYVDSVAGGSSAPRYTLLAVRRCRLNTSC